MSAGASFHVGFIVLALARGQSAAPLAFQPCWPRPSMIEPRSPPIAAATRPRGGWPTTGLGRLPDNRHDRRFAGPPSGIPRFDLCYVRHRDGSGVNYASGLSAPFQYATHRPLTELLAMDLSLMESGWSSLALPMT